MKLCEVVGACVLFAYFLGISFSALKTAKNSTTILKEQYQEYKRDELVVRGFEKLCMDKNTANTSFMDFAEYCQNYLGIQEMEISPFMGEQKLKCRWKNSGKVKYMVCRREL